MASRWSSIAVVLFWMTSMGWLVEQKILPSWVVGDPPTYRTILQDAVSTPVGWTISLNDRPLGWAISQSSPTEQGGYELRNRVWLDRLPFSVLAPTWVTSIMKVFERKAPEMKLDVDLNSAIGIDPLGRPVDFRSVAEIGYATRSQAIVDPTVRISIRGVVEGNQLKLAVRTGGSFSESEVYLPANALLGDSLSPQARLPKLRVGQRWNSPIYSPFRQQMEMLQAVVERREAIRWNGENRSTLLVVMRNDAGSGLTNGQSVRARQWVANDGTVLKQEVMLGTSRLSFERVATEPRHAPTLDESLQPWWTVLSSMGRGSQPAATANAD
jgi:hypothetical protein